MAEQLDDELQKQLDDELRRQQDLQQAQEAYQAAVEADHLERVALDATGAAEDFQDCGGFLDRVPKPLGGEMQQDLVAEATGAQAWGPKRRRGPCRNPTGPEGARLLTTRAQTPAL